MGTVNEALSLARAYHKGQVDKCGQPYIGHVMRVMARVAGDDVEDDKAMQVALLHDIIEDTACTVKELENVFEEDVVEAVVWLTRPKNDPRTYMEYIRDIKPNVIARRVKVADLADNMDPNREWPKEWGERTESFMMKRYQKAYEHLLGDAD